MSNSNGDARRYNSRLGLKLFAVYLVLYMVFVLTNAFAADKMEVIVLAGLNLAIVYGFGLIIMALVMALIYGWMCRREDESAGVDGGDA